MSSCGVPTTQDMEIKIKVSALRNIEKVYFESQIFELRRASSSTKSGSYFSAAKLSSL